MLYYIKTIYIICVIESIIINLIRENKTVSDFFVIFNKDHLAENPTAFTYYFNE